jgi:hypothetical protein
MSSVAPTGQDNQLWSILPGGQIQNKNTSLVLNIQGQAFTPGTPVIAWPFQNPEVYFNDIWDEILLYSGNSLTNP